MVRRPIVEPHRIVIAVEVLREVHGRLGTERMRNLAGIRPVSGIRDDVESRKGSFFPAPCYERPSRLIDVHVGRKAVGVERRYRGRGGFSEGGIGFQNFVRSAYGVDQPVGIDRVTRFSPNQIRLECQTADILRRTVARIRHDIEVLRRVRYCRRGLARRRQRPESRRRGIVEGSARGRVVRRSGNSSLSEIVGFGLRAVRSGIRCPRIRAG